MAGDLTQALKAAQSGLLAHQAALDSVANNIANVNSVGYSRKIVNMEQRVVAGTGAGVQISDVIRRVDQGLMKSLRLEISKYQALDVQSNYYDRVQETFGAPGDNNSIAHIFEEFSNAVETLAVSADRTLEQSDVVRWGQNIVLKLQSMSNTIQDLRLQADKAIADIVERVNQLSTRIDELNDNIISNSTVGRDVTDLLDQRDGALDELASLIDISYFYRSDGDVVVFTTAGRTLVDNTPATLSHSPASSVTPTTTHAEGDFGGLFINENTGNNDITSEIRGGQLKGLIDLRDDVLPNLQSQLDNLAGTLRDEFNKVHNRGAPFPGINSATGSRIFTEPGTQTITIDAANSVDDVTIALFDVNGDQTVSTKLSTIMTDAAIGPGALTARGPWTIDNVATKLQNWLQANGAATAAVDVDASGHFTIELNTSTVGLVFRDETATTAGSTQADAAIGFDADGDGTIDQTISGFSNFFGLNDFFVDNLAENVYESAIQSAGFSSGAGTLVFRDAGGAMTGSPLAITAGSSLQDIATAINNGMQDITATVVPDGSGFRLRISHDQGSSFTLTQSVGTILTTVGMEIADVRVSSTLDVRSDIISNPGNIAIGAMQWDANLGASGEYFMSVGDDTVAQQLATLLTSNSTFNSAGGLSQLTTSFTGYATSIVARNADLAASHEQNVEFEASLTEALQGKSDNVRGVNLDEEMSTLILFQQAYSAAARVISVIQRMFDALDRAVA